MAAQPTMLAIVNPAAGGGRCGRRAPAAIDELRARGMDIAVRETQRAQDATAIAREAYAAGIRDFIAVGGDGTAHEVVNGLFPQALEGGRPSLGFLPLGTGNSFLRDFGDDGARHARQALEQGLRRSADVLRIRHRDGEVYSLNIISVGFIADVCELANRSFKAFGAAGYVLGVAGQLMRFCAQPFPFRLDGSAAWDAPASMISFSNSKHTGGSMRMAPAARVDDGKLDVTFIGALERWPFVKAFPTIFAGKHVSHPAVRVDQAARVDFAIDGATGVMVDGEVLSLVLQSIEVLPNALDVRV